MEGGLSATGALFAEVNVIEDPDTRLDVWATKADAIVETYCVPTARGTTLTPMSRLHSSQEETMGWDDRRTPCTSSSSLHRALDCGHQKRVS